MATYDPTMGNFESYWNRQFQNDPEMQRIHAAEVVRAKQKRVDAAAKFKGGRRRLGLTSERDKETAATARARAMGWAPPDHDWSVDWTDTGFRTEKRNILDRNKAGLFQTGAGLVLGAAALPYLTGGAAASGASGAVPSFYTAGLAPVASGLTAPTVTGAAATGIGSVAADVGSVAAKIGGFSTGGGAGATKAAGAVELGKKAVGWLGTDEASALGKVAAWGAGAYGERRAEDIREADKAVVDQRYQDALDLSAQQRTQDLQLDADREAALQARWDAEQLRLKTIWEARETRLEPYREVGRQTLASLSNMETPTRERYRSRYMG